LSVKSYGGVNATFSSEFRDINGNLIVRMVSLTPPKPPACINPVCLARYVWDGLTYAAIALYDSRRCHYAANSRLNKKILERYRTGDPMPRTLWQAVHGIIKIKCPVCRKYNVDPLLFSSMYKDHPSE
jgi:hypothetical protein